MLLLLYLIRLLLAHPFPSDLSIPSYSSGTLWEDSTPEKLPINHGPKTTKVNLFNHNLKLDYQNFIIYLKTAIDHTSIIDAG